LDPKAKSRGDLKDNFGVACEEVLSLIPGRPVVLPARAIEAASRLNREFSICHFPLRNGKIVL